MMDRDMSSVDSHTSRNPLKRVRPPPSTPSTPTASSSESHESHEPMLVDTAESLLRRHINQKLQDAALGHFITAVDAVLQAASWRTAMFDDPNNKARLVAVLKDPWLYYHRTKETLPGLELDEITLGKLYSAAIVIAAVLMKATESVPAQPQHVVEGNTPALGRARDFLETIMREPEEIPNTEGMRVMRDVLSLESGSDNNKRDIVIRNIIQRFWTECIRVVHSPKGRHRVCVVGSPGIGKTACTPLLIRMLLNQENATVVYLVRTISRVGWYYEFTTCNGSSTAAIFPESWPTSVIKSLSSSNTYFVVDPGMTKQSCDPETAFPARVILICSPDNRLWGESEFTKNRDGVRGSFRYFPLWSLDDLLSSRHILNSSMSADEVNMRYRQFGGTPRLVFGDPGDVETALSSQNRAIGGLTSAQVVKIARGGVDFVVAFKSSQPKSCLVGYDVADGDRSPVSFNHASVVVMSPLISEKIYSAFMKDVWQTMIDLGENGWNIFEAYTRELMVHAQELPCRKCCGKGKGSNSSEQLESKKLGNCQEIRLDTDILVAALQQPNVVFHSIHRSYYELIDFIYQDSEGHVHAFQVTTGTKHSAKSKHIKELVTKVSNAQKKCSLYYLVPSNRFANFVTDPVNPLDRMPNLAGRCDIWHVHVPDPNGESNGIGDEDDS